MKNKFHGYYKPSTEEFKALWDESLIVLDANVLLNLYTYSSETWEEILGLLEGLGDRVWLPYQVALEYHRGRSGKIDKEVTRYDEILSNLRGVSAALAARKQHPFIDPKTLGSYERLIRKIEKELAVGKDAHMGLVREDPIRERITKLFDGSVGEPFQDDKLDEIYKEGEERYAKNIPPGYMDEKKPEPSHRFGDLVIWKQIIQHAKQEKRSVIFVTDDEKEDWWMTSGSSKLGPRPELLHEFRRETEKDLYIYGTVMFTDLAKQHGKEISENAVKELQSAEEQRQREDAAAIRATNERVAGIKETIASVSPSVVATIKQLDDARAMLSPSTAAAFKQLDHARAMLSPSTAAAFKLLDDARAMLSPSTAAAFKQLDYARAILPPSVAAAFKQIDAARAMLSQDSPEIMEPDEEPPKSPDSSQE